MTKQGRAFTSHVKMMVMTLTVPHSGRWFYQREIQLITGIAYTPVRAALIDLDAFGLLTKRTHGNRQYYMVNKDFLLYEEYRNIVLKTTGLGDHLRWMDREEHKITTVFVYGDFAEGTETTDTPIRFCSIDRMKDEIFEDAVATAKKLTEKEIEYIRMTPEQLKQHVADQDKETLALIDGKKIFIEGSPKILTDLISPSVN